MLILRINQQCATRQITFSNDFFKTTLVEGVYIALPSYFDTYTDKDRAEIFMKINNSLYALLQSPFDYYNHLKGSFEAIGFKPRPLDPCMFYGRGIFLLIYVDDLLLFGPDQYNILKVVKELEDYVPSLTA